MDVYTGTVKQNTPLFAEERRIRIVDYVETHRQATVAELVDEFSVSSATIRNDLRDLARAHLLIRTHGGAIVKGQTGFELPTNQKTDQNLEAKRTIARLALELVSEGDTVVLDSGTTTLELAKLLGGRSGVSVVTNSLPIGLVLEEVKSIQILLLGGVVRKGFHCTVGLARHDLLAGLTVDKAFMGLNGLSLTKGASTPDLTHAEIKRKMISIANQVILLCDSSKIGRDAFAQFAPLEDIDMVVTEAIGEEMRQRFEEADIEVITP